MAFLDAEIEELKATDPAKAEELSKDLNQLEGMTAPAQIKAKAREKTLLVLAKAFDVRPSVVAVMTLVGVAFAFAGLVLLAGPDAGLGGLSPGETLTLFSAVACAVEIVLHPPGLRSTMMPPP